MDREYYVSTTTRHSQILQLVVIYIPGLWKSIIVNCIQAVNAEIHVRCMFELPFVGLSNKSYLCVDSFSLRPQSLLHTFLYVRTYNTPEVNAFKIGGLLYDINNVLGDRLWWWTVRVYICTGNILVV